MKAFCLFSLGVLLPGIISLLSQGSVVFQSSESVTENNEPVYNEVKVFLGWKKDTWFLRQSHHGYNSRFHTWDRLAIIVDKQSSPYKALFYQLQPGKTTEQEIEKIVQQSVPLKVRCVACHSNGPRAIRPEINLSTVQLSLWHKTKIFAWNLRMKTYGPMENLAGTDEPSNLSSPLAILKKEMALDSCTNCHSSRGIRNPLTLEQLGTAASLVRSGAMPPFPFSVSGADKAFLDKLTRN